MSAGARVAAFAGLLAVVFTAAVVAGRAVDLDTTRAGTHVPGDGVHGQPATSGEMRVVADRTRLPLGATAAWAFRIVDARGSTVRHFETEQGKRMHVVVVRRDLRHYQHLHPRQTADGRWKLALTLTEPGSYRAFADFHSAGDRRTASVDLVAAGAFAPLPLPAPSTVARVDGYEVALRDGPAGRLTFVVARAGAPVGGLQPHLGARGHLVALRTGDLAYAHMHPAPATAPAEIAFDSSARGPGTYRLFLQFRHAGRVRTAAFTRGPRP